MADYCDPDLMLITKLDSSIFSSELLPKGYVGEFRRDRNLNGGGVMIVTKDCYTIINLVLQTATQNDTKLVWATITLKDHSKLVVGSFYLPPNKRVSPILELRLFPKQDFSRCKQNQPGARTYWISSVVISPRLLKLAFPFLVFRTTVLF